MNTRKKLKKIIKNPKTLFYYLKNKIIPYKINEKEAFNILNSFQEIVPKSFAVYGTCLGLLRDKKIIKHDIDVDIGIMKKDFDLNYVNKLISQKFKLIYVFGMMECGLELSFRKNGVKIDLMIYYQTNETIYNCLWDNGGANGFSDMIVHSYNINNFKNINKIKKIRCLNENYIKRVYGKNWRTPIKKWDWKTDHKCIDNHLKEMLIKKYGYL